MIHSLLVPHKEITTTLLDEVIQIKSIAWPYSYEKQLEWIYNNLKKSDIHVLLYLNESLVAYLNLIEIEFKIDGDLKNGYGIGNVCAREIGKGWGKGIIKDSNTYLARNNKIGLLFCKDSLVDFYKNYNWRLIDKSRIKVSFQNESIETMIFNFNSAFQIFEYPGKPF